MLGKIIKVNRFKEKEKDKDKEKEKEIKIGVLIIIIIKIRVIINNLIDNKWVKLKVLLGISLRGFNFDICMIYTYCCLYVYMYLYVFIYICY